MSDVPEGAELSEDGQWWWDGSNWVAVGGGGGQDTGGQDGGSKGEPAFDFTTNGLVIDPEAMGTPSANEPLKAAFTVCNTGTAAGSAHVVIFVDGSDTGVAWDSPNVEAGQCATPDGDGYVKGIPGQSEGEHKFEAWVTPAGSNGGYAVNTIKVGAPEN